MIVDAPVIFPLALGVDRRIPEDGDAQLKVPSVLMCSTEPIQSPTIVNASADVQLTSFWVTTDMTRTNQAQLIQNIATLAKGLWQFLIFASMRINWVPAAGITAASLRLNFPAFAPSMIRMLGAGAAGLPVAYQNTLDYRVLIPEQTIIQGVVELTGAAQTTDFSVAILGNRIL